MFKLIRRPRALNLTVLFLILVPSVLSSCAVHERISGVNNTFLEDVDISSKRPNLPFEHAWVDPQFDKSSYKSVYFKPVRIDLLPKDDWTKSASMALTSEQDYFVKAKEIAQYFDSELIEKVGSLQNKRLSMAKRPGPGTLVVEIALTELELSHPFAQAGSLASPIPGTGAAVSAVSDPHVAFAARVTDGATGKLVSSAADRKFAPTRVFDLNKFTVSSSAREIVSIWADIIAASVQGDGTSKISGKSYDWMPW